MQCPPLREGKQRTGQYPGATMDAIRLERAELRTRGGARLVGPLDLRVEAGQRWALLGPNGSGKTSLLLLAGARRQPVSGAVEVLGERLGAVDVRVLRRRIGHVSHRLGEAVRPAMPALDVVLTGMRGALESWLAEFSAEERAAAAALLDEVGCGPLAARPLGTCSQGERARILLARALAAKPELLLLDEPAAGLDLPAREALVAAVDRSPARTVVLATHHVEELPPSISHAALLRDGRLVAAGPLAEVLMPGPLAECFGLPIHAERRNGRWSATAPHPGTGTGAAP
jgi:iron complex transport system ATP-binding protein